MIELYSTPTIDDRSINSSPDASYSNLAFGQRTIKTHTPTGAAGEWLALLQVLKGANVRELKIGSGTVLCDSTENMAGYNQKRITMHDGCIVHSTLAAVDNHSSTPLYWDGLTPDATTATRIGTSGLNGAAFATLTASVTRSSADIGRRFTIADTTGLDVGQQIAAVFKSGGTNVFIRTYKVTAIVSGTVFEVDRPIIYPFLVTSGTIYKIALTEDVHIEGGQVEGTGDRLIQLVSAWRCSLKGIVSNSSSTSLSVALDGGPYDCDVENVKASIIATSNYALALEMGEKLRMKGCVAKGLGAAAGQAAIALVSCDDVTVYSCSGQASLRGLMMANNDALDTYGNHGINVIGGTYSGNGTGAEVGSYASDIKYHGSKFSDNVNAGARVTTTGARGKWIGCQFERNGYSLHISGGRGHVVSASRFEGTTSGHLVLMDGASPELLIADTSMSETTTANAYGVAINGTGTADLKIARTSLDVTKAGGAGGILLFSAADITLDDFEVTKSSGTQGNVVVSGGTASTLTLKGRNKAIGTSMTTGISLGATDKLRAYGDLTQLQTITAVNKNWGSAVLVGGTVTVANTGIVTGDRVRLTMTTPGGVPGFLSYVIVNATSLQINSSSGIDTSTVAFEYG